MELIEFVTPSGHKAYFKPYLTYGDKRQIQAYWASIFKIKADQQEDIKEAINNAEIGGDAAFKAQDLLVKLLLVKVVGKDGLSFEGNRVFDVVMSMDEADGKAIYDKADEITKSENVTPEDKKKLS